MLSVPALLDLLNDKNYKTPPFIVKWRGVYFGMSLHTTGACPAFRLLSNGNFEGSNGTNSGRGSRSRGGLIFPVGFYGWQYQDLFEIYLLNRHPREPEETHQWRLSQYRPYQRDPLLKCISIVSGAIFQDGNYGIHMEDQEDNDYIFGNNFNGSSLIGYIIKNFQWICEDPNGIFVTIPKEPYYETTTPRIEPHVYFIPSRDIITITEDEVVFTINDIAWVVNNQYYFRFKKDDTGKYIHIDHEYGGFFAHMRGKIPYVAAGGIWNTQGFYESWLNAAKAVADDIVSARSALQLVNKEASHPFIIEASTECPDCNASGMQTVPCEESEENPSGFQLVRCPTCGGSHSISHNPGDRYIVPPEQMKEKLVQIINPDVNVNKFHSDEVRNMTNDMLRALHLNYVDQAQSGVAKDKDMESRYQFISNISNDIFDRLITSILTDILSLRNVEVTNGVLTPKPTQFYITKPTQFQIKTSAELLEEYKASVAADIPDFVRQAQLEDYVDKQFGGNDVLKRKTAFILRYDPLAVTPETNKQARVLNGAATNREWQVSVLLSKLLDTIIRENGAAWFTNASFEEISGKVEAQLSTIPEVPMVAKASTSQDRLT
jgi:hypothetical protein